MVSTDADRAASRALRREGWLLHAHMVEIKFQALREAVKANFDPNQPRVPVGNPDGGQWTDGDSGSGNPTALGGLQETTPDNLIQLAGDISGFTRHGINQTITRGVSPSAMLDALTNPLQIVPQSNGTTRYVGAGAVVVLNPAGGVVTVRRR